MAVKKKTRKRVKKSGVIYFATNSRVPNMVKIGMTIVTAEERIIYANRKHEFMAGTWQISQKVKTNDTKRTEDLAHNLFNDYHDQESVSKEMYFVPEGWSIKKMADEVRKKDKILLDRAEKTEKAEAAIEAAKKQLAQINQETEDLLSLPDE
jgi:hypothetical protein